MVLRAEFANAMDISSSCFVFASAGSGKTKILVDRFVKYLMFGYRSTDIMCVTFTRAAAFEMETRIESVLKKLETCTQEVLYEYLQNTLYIDAITEKNVQRARELYSEWLIDYSSLKIVTIHSFCQKLLEQYPIESGVDLEFEVMDELDSKTMIEEAKNRFFKKIINTSEDATIRELSQYLSSYSFEELLEKIVSNLPKFRRFINRNPDTQKYKKKLEILFRKTDIQYLPDKWRNYHEDVFLTKTGSIRKKIKIPEVSDAEIRQIADIFFENRSTVNKDKTIAKTTAFISVANEILRQYEELKRSKNTLDFTDIIYQTEFLLRESPASNFVIFQVSSSIKHIMVDEAQDLNVDQWQIISILFEEIFINNTGHNTIFVVGDLKQSIYGFQDANPDYFMAFHKKCNDILPKVDKKINTVYLKNCYRCAPEILTFVDQVFMAPGSGMSNYKKHIPHLTNRGGVAELVPINELENDIVKLIQKLINEENVDSNDIMILAKNRNSFEGLIEKVSEAGIQTSGLDRVNLGDFLIIKDVIGLAEICIDRSNDYVLASILKSYNIFEKPLNYNEVSTICANRQGTVYEELDSNNYSEYVNFLDQVKYHYDTSNLVEFFYFIYKTVADNCSKFDKDILYSFLEIVGKRYEKYAESTRDFVIWFKENQVQYQNENGIDRGIRFSTIHGSKGLESEVILLIDFSIPPDKNKIKFLWEELDKMLFIVKPNSKESFEEIEELIESFYAKEKEENFRLLYVALTRAKKRLYVLGSLMKDGVFNYISEKIYA